MKLMQEVFMVSRRRFIRPPSPLLLHPIRVTFHCSYSTDSNRQSDKVSTNNNNDKNNNDNLATSKPPPYQDTFAAIQQLSRSHMDKLQRDLQPWVRKVQDTTNTLKRLSHDVTDSKDALDRARLALNELTGYNQIELVKKKVTDQATAFEQSRDQVQLAKKRYEVAISTRSSTQRGINELLQRKHLWTGDDVTQFTELYRLEHEHAKEETMAKEHYERAEKQMDREYMALVRAITDRYHDEQLWSDKIRSVSTYGTWALMVLNLMLFVAVQTVFEPRKRKRLTDGFEELLVDKMAEQEHTFSAMTDALEHTDQVLMSQQQILVDLLNQVKDIPYTEVMDSPPEQENALDQQMTPTLTTDTQVPLDTTGPTINLSQRSLILYSLESAIAGGLITALAMFLWK
ncbi:Mdm33 family-domain-containing protein [Halteromyces radiatus]|uniref:Mdm33 family-domain-containing protein n=1 Tax=Halteromyces radiatus TaxID=101107 RepID=UPI0022202D5D|nr:Mdm33 family-domain-containing protein [Halteromyces radiatus]KAI8092648.1 Mdm33 family-domain-containing protein [Halteromyces radiatus]